MADQDDVRRIALSLPETHEAEGHFGFSVSRGSGRKQIVWAWNERVDPEGPRVRRDDVIVVRVAGPADKAALLAAEPEKFFTEPHYDGYPAVLVRLDAVSVDELEELITEAWLAQASRAMARSFEAARNR